MRRVFADTSAFIAAWDPRDQEHERAVQTIHALAASRTRLVTTNFILDESLTWFRKNADAREQVGRAILESAFVDFVRLEAIDEHRAWEMCLKRRDQAFSFTDLTSFVLMERLRLREVFTFDDDFRRFGKFTLIPGPDA